jgi:hypothetical protein
MEINDPSVIAELQELYPHYETALMANDADTLTKMLGHTSRDALRSGENLYGIDEIAAFRKGPPPYKPGADDSPSRHRRLQPRLRQHHPRIRTHN